MVAFVGLQLLEFVGFEGFEFMFEMVDSISVESCFEVVNQSSEGD